MMSHHARRPKETLLYLPPLVPARSTSRIPSTSLPTTRLPGCPPQEDAGGMAAPESGLLHRPPDPRSAAPKADRRNRCDCRRP